jgi:solute carrier family 25 uncoupling protein 8/9
MSGQPSSKPNQHSSHLSLPKLMLAGGLAASIAEIVTIPLDTIKVRMQLRQGIYPSLSQCGLSMIKDEGLLSLYRGLSAALMRQLSFASLRIGLFDLAMQKIELRKGSDGITLIDRIAWGILSGAAAICVANPFDVVKVRFQNDARSGGKPRYSGFLHAMKSIAAQEGLHGFYQSLPPNIFRNSIFNAVELATYSQVKAVLLRNKMMEEGYGLHFTASAFAGLLAVGFGSPFDVLKSLIMDGKTENGVKVPFTSIWDATKYVFRKKGVAGFYAGLNANFQRIVSWNIIMFMAREQILIQFRPKQNK